MGTEQSRDHIRPGVVLDGQTVHPPNWMWVLGFALGGCEWAIKACETNDWKNQAREWFKDQKRERLEAQLVRAEKELQRLKEELCRL